MPSPSLTLLRTQSDERLVALVRDGHERAFEAIVERYRRPLLRGARRVLPEGRAEDALQQALLSAWTALQRGDEVRDLRPWLFRIVHNCALNALRVSGYEYDELHDALRIADAPGDELERRAVMRQTLASVAALPDRQREALLRTAVSGDPQDEVARSLGVSDNALRQLVHRARVSIRAAATAITPLPLLTWPAGGSRGSLAERIAELAAGAAPAGAAATLAKAGTVAVMAGGALTGPALIDNITDHAPKRASIVAEARAAPRPVHTSTPDATRRAAAVPATKGAVRPSRAAARRALDGAGEALPGRRRSGRERDQGNREDVDDAEDRRGANRRGGSPRSGSERHESDEADEDRRGPGGGAEPEDEPADEPAGDEDGSTASGEATEEAHSQPVPVPTDTPEPDEAHSQPVPVPTDTPEPQHDE
jgi:RNA polymerase sigma factor (sigma-70 family)